MSAVAAVSAGRRRRDNLGRAIALTWTLAVSEWKLRFYGSVLGYFWSLARPFLLFGVIYVVFTQFVQLGDQVPHYPVYILLALVLFQFFQEIATNGLFSLVNRENLLRKVRIPPLVIPCSVALTALFNLGMTLAAVLIFAMLNGVYPRWTWLELPVLVLLLTMLGLGRRDGVTEDRVVTRERDVY